MPSFQPSLELNAAFYAEAVEPLIRPYDHAAGLLGWGSDVLGYDTERSTDHGWGPRLQIFVAGDRLETLESVRKAIDAGLPESFRGWPARYGWDDTGVQHFVEVTTPGAWLVNQVGVDPRAGLTPRDWLTIPQQQLLGVVRGAVYADPHGDLAKVRTALAYYPDDVWRWLVTCQWHRLAQEEHLIGRAAQVGDELGSRVAGARQVRELMRLGFLLDQAYWPYTKWFGTAFAELPIAADLGPHLDAVLAAADYATREPALCAAYEVVARRHNAMGITEALDPTVRQFHGRPFRVLMADRFADATRATVQDTELRELPMWGGVDQFVDSTDVLSGAGEARRLRRTFEPREG